MRGFIAGSFGLIVLYVALKPGSASAVESGSGWIASAARRLMSPDVAGIPRAGRVSPGRNQGSGPGPAQVPNQPTRPPVSSSFLPGNAPVYV